MVLQPVVEGTRSVSAVSSASAGASAAPLCTKRRHGSLTVNGSTSAGLGVGRSAWSGRPRRRTRRPEDRGEHDRRAEDGGDDTDPDTQQDPP